MKKYVVFFLIVFMFFALNVYAQEKTLLIGVSGTYTGGFASVGKHVCDGMTDYLNWINDRGGIQYKDPVTGKTENVTLKIFIEDNQYNVSKAVIAYRNLKAKGVNVIIGFGSTPGQACSAIASKDKIPYLSWYSYASPAGYKTKPQYYWSFLPTIAESATPMIKWFVTQKWQGRKTPKIGIIAANVPSWKMLGKPGMMDTYIKSIGGEFAGIEFIPLSITDLTGTIVKLVFQKKADCIILIGTTSQTVVLAKDLKRMKISPDKITVICSLSAWDESLFQSIPQAVKGLYGEVHAVSLEKQTPGINKVKEIAKKAGRDPEKLVMNYINGFMGAFALETAVKRGLEKYGYEKTVMSGEIIKNELHNFKPADPFGLAPAIEVKYSDMPYFMNYARMVKAGNGKFEDAGDWVSFDRLKGSLEF